MQQQKVKISEEMASCQVPV